jgi:N-acetylmuramoyl-L-alanine amidase
LIGLVFFLQTAAAMPATFNVRQADAVRTVPVIQTVSGPYLRADLLATALGGTSAEAPRGRYRLTLGESVIDMIEGVPFVRVNANVAPLDLPPLRSGRTFLVPYQLATTVIPKFATGFIYDLGSSEMRIFNTAARKGTPSVDASPTDTDVSTSTVAAPSTPSRPRRAQHRLIVVDAGHGGVDPGMRGPIGNGPRIVEKNVTLAVARLLAAELRSDGVDVLMTRTSDTLIALYDRGRIANRNKGDLFVSIHVNATGARGSAGARERGYETYFLAEAKTEEASRVERMENEAVKFETGANAPKGDPLSFIINDMAQNEHLRESNDLAETIQEGLRSFHPGKDRGVQQATFAVLRGSYMPAVLVEIGFGTNPTEAAYLLDSDNQRQIAASVAKSVMEYLDHYDARVGPGTR